MSNVLEIAKAESSEHIRTGSSAMKLVTHTENMVRHQDSVIRIYESMDAEYAGNMVEMLGEEGMADALDIYKIIKQCRELLKVKGI